MRRAALIALLLVVAIPLRLFAAEAAASAADTLFEQPYIDVDEWRDQPVRHRYVHGGFKGTDTRFSFYFPPKAQYSGRFFQYITPIPDNEYLSQNRTGEEDSIGFAIASGAYYIETNGGGRSNLPAVNPAADLTITAYRANAAAARYSRVVAAQMYGGQRPFGYAFGGSGGSYRTIGAFENTIGVWDGVVPYVMPTPIAIPNMFSVRMHAMRVLKDKFPQIVDALEPGGSGDMYAGLNAEERAALQEVTKLGFPPKSWFGYRTMGVHAFTVLYPGVVLADPAYFTDFWTKPGYLGFDPPPSLRAARLQFSTTIAAPISASRAAQLGLDLGDASQVRRGTADAAWRALGREGDAGPPVAFELKDTPPAIAFLGGDLLIRSGAAAGKTVPVRALQNDKVVVGAADPSVLTLIEAGDAVQVDNSNFLAAQTYHRHQVPGPDYPVWDQFRGPDGKPLYPQRPRLIGPLFALQTGGALQTGKFTGKMIVVATLWDREAFPWQADWYRAKVREHLGAATDDHYRLWYVDHALHTDSTAQEDPTHTVSYLGVLQQALRDLSAWVEKGVPPPSTTRYEIVDGQVVVPDEAAARGGVQPVVTLTANGGKRADVRAGQAVTLTASIDVPPRTGSVVAAAWDLDGSGQFSAPATLANQGNRWTATLTHTFTQPGTYFPVLRAASQREADAKTPYARIQNLDRVRVIVR